MTDLVQHGRAGDDPSFWLTEFAAPDGCDVDDRDAWRTANPALACRDPFLAEDALEALLHTTREGTFRQLCLGQWDGQVEGWLPWDPPQDRRSGRRDHRLRPDAVAGF